MRALQSDWHNGQAARLLPTLLAQLGDDPLPEAAGSARRRLAAWAADPVSAPELSAPLIFERWYLQLAEDLFAERLGDALWSRLLRRNYVLNHALDALILAPDEDSPWWGDERGARVRAAFVTCVARLAEELGADPAGWRWDARHRVTLQHELSMAVPVLGRWLDRGPYPWGGGHATVGRARTRYDRPERVSGAATVRVVIEMTEPMRIWAVIPGGQSGHPADPHYDDQIEPWLHGRHLPVAARFSDAAGTSLRLEPAAAGTSRGSRSLSEGR
jgi:penicillin amidase